MSKLNFKKPSGQSRLSEASKTGIIKGELQRFNFDLPKELALKLKIRAATESTTMRNITVEALSKYLNN